jgi:hypothetical protein
MKPDFSILSEHQKDGFTAIVVDTTKATYQGIAWGALGDWGKRKFENILFLTRSPERIKIVYA